MVGRGHLVIEGTLELTVGGDVFTFRRRAPYSPIAARPRLVLPGGARIAVWTIVNVENWAPAAAMPRAVLAQRSLKASFALNSSVCTEYPAVCQAALDAGWDFMGHGFVQKPMRRVVSIPCTVEVNDVAIPAVQQHGSDELLRRGRDQFDRHARPRRRGDVDGRGDTRLLPGANGGAWRLTGFRRPRRPWPGSAPSARCG